MTYYRTEVLADSPAIYMPLDGSATTNLGSKSGVAVTSSGGFSYASGRIGTAPDFTGPATAARIEYNLNGNAHFNDNAWTIEMWFKVDAFASGYMQLFQLNDGANLIDALYDYGDSKRLKIRHRRSGGSIYTLNTGISQNTSWHHLVITRSGTTLTAYLDGSSAGSVTVDSTNPSFGSGTSFFLGAWGNSSGSDNFDGLIDEFAIYDTNLSSGRISAHYAADTFLSTTIDVSTVTSTLQIVAPTVDTNIRDDAISNFYTYTTGSVGGTYPGDDSDTEYLGFYSGARYHGVFKVATPTIPSGQAATSAKLRIYLEESVSGTKVYNIRQATSADTTPTSTLIGTVTVPDGTAVGWFEVDVAEIVNNWNDGETNHGIVIEYPSGSGGILVTDSNGTNPPVLRTISGESTSVDIDVTAVTMSAQAIDPTLETGAAVQTSTLAVSLATQDVVVESGSDVDVEINLTTLGITAQAHDAAFEEIRTAVLNPSFDNYWDGIEREYVDGTDFLVVYYEGGGFPGADNGFARMYFDVPGALVTGTVLSATLRLNVESNAFGGNFIVQTMRESGGIISSQLPSSVTTTLPVGINNIDLTNVLHPDKFNIVHVGRSGTSPKLLTFTASEDGNTSLIPRLTVRYLVDQGATVVDSDTATLSVESDEIEVEVTTTPNANVNVETATVEVEASETAGFYSNVTVDADDTDSVMLGAYDVEVDAQFNAVSILDTPKIGVGIYRLTDVNGQPVLPTETEDEYFNSTMRTLSGRAKGFSGGLQSQSADFNLDMSQQSWFRFNEASGTVAYDRAYILEEDGDKQGQGFVDLYDVTIGLHDGPEDRHNFYFNGAAFAAQRENSAADEIFYKPTSLEFTFRTERTTQFLMGGSDREYDLNIDNNPPWELWLVDGKLEIRQYEWTKGVIKSRVTGFTNLADGEWHHVVIQNSHEGSGQSGTGNYFNMEFYVDANLEVRRRVGPGPQGFPDFIGGRPNGIYYYTDMSISNWFLGDMTEVVFRNGRTLTDDEIAIQRDNMMGIFAVRPETARVTLNASQTTDVRGNKPRVLVLDFGSRPERGSSWSVTAQAVQTQNKMIYHVADSYDSNASFNFDFVGYGEPSWGYAATSDVEGVKYQKFTKSVWFNPKTNTTFRDPITDNHRLIDLENLDDINMDEYEIISIVGYPRNNIMWSLYDQLDYENAPPMVPMRKQLENLMDQVRDQVRYERKSLYVTDPFSAIELGIINRAEYVPNIRESLDIDNRIGAVSGLYDAYAFIRDPFYGAKPDQPYPIDQDWGVEERNRAARYEDTHWNNKQVLKTAVPGLTDLPEGWIQTDEIQWWNVNPMGNPPWHVSRAYADRGAGLQVGDTFYIDTDPFADDRSAFFDIAGSIYRNTGFVAAPVSAIQVGSELTTFAPLVPSSTIKEGEPQTAQEIADGFIGNPYGDYAVSIVVQPGDAWDGVAVNGKVYVNFTEANAYLPEDIKFSKIIALTSRGFSEDKSVGIGDVFTFSDGGSWTVTAEHLKYQFSTHYGSNQGTQIYLPQTSGSGADWGWSPGGTRGGTGGGLGAGEAMQYHWRPFYQLEVIATPTLSNRALRWMALDLDVSGNAGINLETAKVNVQSVETTVEVDKNTVVDLATARVNVESYNDLDTIDPDATVLVGTAAVVVRADEIITDIELDTARIVLQPIELEPGEYYIDWSDALVLTLPRQALKLTLEDAPT